MSQFGVMFFDEPTVAFTNIRAQMTRGARLAFACWQASANNPWHYSAALKGDLAAAATARTRQEPDRSIPRFADPALRSGNPGGALGSPTSRLPTTD